MPSLTPRQVAVRAQEAASQLLLMLDRGAVVQRFLRAYVNDKNRPGCIAEPQRYRDLVEAIRRESLLFLARQVESQAPSRLGIRSSRRGTPSQVRLLDLFRQEFLFALTRVLDWDDEESANFLHDLELFRKLYPSVSHVPKYGYTSAMPKGPFVDRCGLLLDAPMLDQARRAAAKFESELLSIASVVLKKVFSRSISR